MNVCQDVSQMATELKSRAAAYNNVKTSLQSYEYKLQWVTLVTLRKITSRYQLWNVELKHLYFQWDFAHSQSDWHHKEGRPGGLRVPHHPPGISGQVRDTYSIYLQYV